MIAKLRQDEENTTNHKKKFLTPSEVLNKIPHTLFVRSVGSARPVPLSHRFFTERLREAQIFFTQKRSYEFRSCKGSLHLCITNIRSLCSSIRYVICH